MRVWVCHGAAQVHYTNIQGVVSEAPDTSGLRIIYTSDVRPHDLGILTLGQPQLMLPPAKSAVVTPANVRCHHHFGMCATDQLLCVQHSLE
jgi:hypothetical protein